VTPYLLEFLPAQALLHLGAPLAMARALAHALRELAPAVALLTCWQITRRRDPAATIAPTVYFIGFALMTWGSPTEIWLVGAFA
jgi:hypothetical protein